jgi:hypothetical protein
MQRPLLNPTIFDDPDRRPLPPPPIDYGTILRAWHRLTGAAARTALVTARVLLTPVRLHRGDGEVAIRLADVSADTASPTAAWVRSRFARLATAIVMRLCGAAAVLSLTVGLLVESITRPLPGDDGPPLAGTLYVQPFELLVGDRSVAGHLIPAISENRVLRHGDRAAKARRPAVLLASGTGDAAHALDGLIVPLHDAGVIVLSLPLARSGDRRTFGAGERDAISAAVEALRRRPDVDAARVSVVATGDAATAALLAARDGTAMTHLILHAAPANFDAVLDDFAVHPRAPPALPLGDAGRDAGGRGRIRRRRPPRRGGHARGHARRVAGPCSPAAGRRPDRLHGGRRRTVIDRLVWFLPCGGGTGNAPPCQRWHPSER